MSRISVFVRLRPQSQAEKRSGMSSMRTEADSELREVRQYVRPLRVFSENNERAKVFKFNKVFTENYSQQQLFCQAEGNKLVEKVLEGYHSTIFAYGQTGSGKTYSMEGLNYQLVGDNPRIASTLDQSNRNLGIIPRAIRYMFARVAADEQRTYQISLSYLQIYNEKIYDLLDTDNRQKATNGLKLRWNKYDQFVVENLEALPCRTAQEALSVYMRGARNKAMARHRMNMNSSRSHTILTIRVQSFDNEDPKNVLSSKFELVDLAGSERQSVTGTSGKQFREGIEINKSLFTLRQVISSLFEYNKNINKVEKQAEFHIPYRDSKLTSILKQSIGGNNYCVMVACLNPGDAYLEETVQTLTYASMASYISNVPVRNEDPKIQQIKMLREQLAEVTEQLHRANEHIKLLSELANKRIQANGSTAKYEQAQSNRPNINAIKASEIEDFRSSQGLNEQHMQTPQERPPSKPRTTDNHQPRPRGSNSLKPKEFIESINMIKDLLQSNIILRENVEKLGKTIDKKDSELYQVMKQNQLLRDRWDLVAPMINAEQAHQRLVTVEDRRNISAYEKMLEDRNGTLKPLKRHPQNQSGTIDQSKAMNMSYNDILRQRSSPKRQSVRRKNYKYPKYL